MSTEKIIEVEMKDRAILESICKKKGYTLKEGTHRLYSSGNIQGLAISIPGWKYPVIVDETGRIHFDDYEGGWGNVGDLRELEANYGAEKLKKAVNKKGKHCTRRETEEVIEMEIYL